jgi:hypothetical protein
MYSSAVRLFPMPCPTVCLIAQNENRVATVYRASIFHSSFGKEVEGMAVVHTETELWHARESTVKMAAKVSAAKVIGIAASSILGNRMETALKFPSARRMLRLTPNSGSWPKHQQ